MRYFLKVIGNAESYLLPLEEDLSLLKCYRRAILCGVVRKSSFLYGVAKHHVECYMKTRRNN